MKEKQIKNPGPDHPISIQHNRARVVVSVAGRVIADTRNALTLREAAYPPVQYIPGEDVDFSQLERMDHVTYSRCKREAVWIFRILLRICPRQYFRVEVMPPFGKYRQQNRRRMD